MTAKLFTKDRRGDPHHLGGDSVEGLNPNADHFLGSDFLHSNLLIRLKIPPSMNLEGLSEGCHWTGLC